MTAADTAAHAVDGAELRRLEQAATPGPWVPMHSGYDDPTWEVSSGGGSLIAEEFREVDATLIAAARNALSALLDMADKCDALAVQLAKAEARCGELVAERDAVRRDRDHLMMQSMPTFRAAKALAPAPNGEKGADDHA